MRRSVAVGRRIASTSRAAPSAAARSSRPASERRTASRRVIDSPVTSLAAMRRRSRSISSGGGEGEAGGSRYDRSDHGAGRAAGAARHLRAARGTPAHEAFDDRGLRATRAAPVGEARTPPAIHRVRRRGNAAAAARRRTSRLAIVRARNAIRRAGGVLRLRRVDMHRAAIPVESARQCPQSRGVVAVAGLTCRPITSTATGPAPAIFSAAAALCTLAPLAHVSSMSSTASPARSLRRVELVGIDGACRDRGARAGEQSPVPIAGVADELADDARQRVCGVTRLVA